MRTQYIKLDTPNPHIARKQEMAEKYPQIKELMGQNRWSALWIMLTVTAQLALAAFFADQSIIYLVLAAYLIGAYANHSLFALVHDCCHNLVFKTTPPNKLLGIFIDTALALPGAIAFRKYHMVHHRHMGEYNMDADIASTGEAKWVGNSTIKKTIWIIFFGLSQALRPMRFKNIKIMDKWVALNLVYSIVANILIYKLLGPYALLYLLLSTVIGLGPHPVGGRWIQEHYVTVEGQETYSYYGPLNKLSYNVGYHNEHHDFMNIPWNNLPKLKAMAPEYYDNLHSYQSWSGVLWNFISNKSISVFDRILHPEKKVFS